MSVKKRRTKFIIFGQGRSGSNLLVDLLNSHPDIYCDRELFNKDSTITRKNIVYRWLIDVFPYGYIKYHLNMHPGKIYGFKLMIYQLMIFKKIQPRLFDESWKIIHIKRDNVLQQTFSAIIAKKSGNYMRTIDDTEDNSTFYIEPQTVFKGILCRNRDLKLEQDILEGLNHIAINYERDLSDDDQWNNSAARIFKYLGTYPVDVSTSTIKTNSISYEERISNYKEILKYLNNTEFKPLVKNLI